MIRSIRGRLTTWYSVVLAIVLIATGAISYGIMRRQIHRTTDASRVTAAARQLAATLRDEAAENSRRPPPQGHRRGARGVSRQGALGL